MSFKERCNAIYQQCRVVDDMYGTERVHRAALAYIEVESKHLGALQPLAWTDKAKAQLSKAEQIKDDKKHFKKIARIRCETRPALLKAYNSDIENLLEVVGMQQHELCKCKVLWVLKQTIRTYDEGHVEEAYELLLGSIFPTLETLKEHVSKTLSSLASQKGKEQKKEEREILLGKLKSKVLEHIKNKHLWNDDPTIENLASQILEKIQFSVAEDGSWKGIKMNLKQDRIGLNTIKGWLFKE